MANENLKELVGRKAAHLVKSGMTIGLGTGSTVFYTIEELGKRIKKEGLEFKAVPTSIDTEEKAKAAGIELIPFEQLETTKIDLAIDGSDEVDKDLNLTKGGGGALLREKRIAYKAKKFVVIIDESKSHELLGHFPVAVEVRKEKWESVKKGLEKIGAKVSLRKSKHAAGEREEEKEIFVTDNGNYILDTKFCYILKPELIEANINNIEGVLENGLFRKEKVSEVWIGAEKGIEIKKT